MHLSLSFFVASVASTAARQVAATDALEPELQIQPPAILDRHEPASTHRSPKSWSQVLSTLQTPMNDDSIESSDYDPECIGIHTLVPVLANATCKGMLLREQINLHATDQDPSPVSRWYYR